KHRLILATALCVETSLDRMRSNDLGEIVDEVEGVILVDERQSVEVRERKRLIGNATEPEVRNVTKADVREEFRDCEAVSARQRLFIGGPKVDEVAARPEDEFIRQRRAEAVGQRQHSIAP